MFHLASNSSILYSYLLLFIDIILLVYLILLVCIWFLHIIYNMLHKLDPPKFANAARKSGYLLSRLQ